MDPWISIEIKKRCVRILAIWVVFILFFAAYIVYHNRYFKNVFYGPFEFDSTRLDAVQDPSNSTEYFIRVTAKNAYDTGLQRVKKKLGSDKVEEVLEEYFALEVGGKFLIIKRNVMNPTSASFSGELKRLPEDVQRKLFSTSEMASARSIIYPLLLEGDEKNFRFESNFIIVVFGVFSVFFLWKGLPIWKQLLDTTRHPVVKRIAEWGDPILISNEAKEDSQSPKCRVREWIAGEKFLICLAPFTFDILRISDLIWAYKSVTTHKTNGVTTNVTRQLVFHCNNLKAVAEGKEQDIDAMLAYLVESCPSAHFGYSEKIQLQILQQISELNSKVPARS